MFVPVDYLIIIFLQSSELQFGFKEKFSCSHAIYIVKEVLSYFNKENTTVNMEALDISKAFDKVNHFVLLPRDSYAKRGICRRLVSVCVCVSVCLSHSGIVSNG